VEEGEVALGEGEVVALGEGEVVALGEGEEESLAEGDGKAVGEGEVVGDGEGAVAYSSRAINSVKFSAAALSQAASSCGCCPFGSPRHPAASSAIVYPPFTGAIGMLCRAGEHVRCAGPEPDAVGHGELPSDTIDGDRAAPISFAEAPSAAVTAPAAVKTATASKISRRLGLCTAKIIQRHQSPYAPGKQNISRAKAGAARAWRAVRPP
jgi:hypothetical protein